jgi:hypothetical protein
MKGLTKWLIKYLIAVLHVQSSSTRADRRYDGTFRLPRRMHPAFKLTVTLALLLVLGGLGVADYYLAEDRLTADVTTQDAEEEKEAKEANDDIVLDGTGGTVIAPEGAVAKNQGITVEQAAAQGGLTLQDTTELTLLGQVVTADTPVSSTVLLKDGDRAGAVAWVESPDVKTIFATLKDSLITVFSPQMQDLRDETIQEANAPVRNILTFLDPSLSEERILFVRVRERLFEFHIAAGKEDVMNAFVQTLTTQ